MKLDRELQRNLLTKLADHYPERDHHGTLFEPIGDDKEAEAKVIANLLYLEEHELIEAGIEQGMDGYYSNFGAKITAKGLDFLADDGGLTAILGTVTVRFHDETLRALIGQKIADAPLAPADKKKWSDALRALPADAIKHLTMKLLDEGLGHAPDAIRIIGSFLS